MTPTTTPEHGYTVDLICSLSTLSSSNALLLFNSLTHFKISDSVIGWLTSFSTLTLIVSSKRPSAVSLVCPVSSSELTSLVDLKNW